MSESAPSLVVDNLNVYYGAVHILHDISLEVFDREIVTLIGANGAGKTTLMMAISGIIPSRTGQIEFLGERTDSLPPHEISARGIAQVAQARHLFPALSVRENLELGAWRWPKRELAQQLDEIYTDWGEWRRKNHSNDGHLGNHPVANRPNRVSRRENGQPPSSRDICTRHRASRPGSSSLPCLIGAGKSGAGRLALAEARACATARRNLHVLHRAA